MATRRDQLQSYQFLLQRIVSALVYRKTDPAESPFRRAGGAIFAGLMLSILALAVTAVIGLFATACGRTAEWTDGEAIIREEETGAFYVILPRADQIKDGGSQTLYPVANFASAALLAGSTDVIEIKQASLRADENENGVPDVSMGLPVGIPGAPNSIPTPANISRGPWTLCSRPATEDRKNPSSRLFIAAGKTKGKELDSGHAFIVKYEDNLYLIAEGHKHAITEPDIVSYLNAPRDNIAEVDAAYVSGIESGMNIDIPDYGDKEETNEDLDVSVGTVFRDDSGGNVTYWVALKDEAAEITQMQAQIISRETGTEIVDNSVSTPDSGSLKPDGENPPPEKVQKFAKPDTGKPVCASFPDDGKQPKILYNAKMPVISGVKTGGRTADGAALADQVVVGTGHGALAESGTDSKDGGLFLVTQGQIYGIDQTKPSKKNGVAAPEDAKTALGYNGEDKPDVVHMPTQLLDLIPAGPQLSPTRAMQSVTGG